MAVNIARITARYEGVNTVSPVRKYNELKMSILKFKIKNNEKIRIESNGIN